MTSIGICVCLSVPTMVNFSGSLTDLNGKPLTGIVGVTFALYREQQGGR